MLYLRFSLSLRNVEGLLHEGGIEFSQERVLVEQDRADVSRRIRHRRVKRVKAFSLWQWHIHEGQRDILPIQ